MKDNMKLYELTINEQGIRFRHANPTPMTAEQKHGIIMALIALAACGLGVGLVWIAATLCDFPGMMFAFVTVIAAAAFLAARE